ncbi:MAG: ABC transporter ATP-binding protein [Firmicutes bacterium]|nr:ABC transporter ATP-binding protein [Bacillota bacterium]
MEYMIKAIDVARGFPVGGDTFWALKDINLTIPTGKLTILKGRSGSGKTTLLNILSALDVPTKGKVYIGETEVTALSDSGRDKLRRKQVGYVYQSVALIPMMTAYENVEFALRLARYEGDWKKRAEECLHMVGLANRMTHMPQEMSGGEQQRVAIARAVAAQPKVLFADEPTAELDTNTGLQVVKIFKDLCAEEGVSVIMTTHDTGLMDIGDALYELEDGQIINRGGLAT